MCVEIAINLSTCKFLGRKRKAIVKGNSVMEFGSKKGDSAVEFGTNHSKQGTEGSFLGVGLMSKLFTDYCSYI